MIHLATLAPEALKYLTLSATAGSVIGLTVAASNTNGLYHRKNTQDLERKAAAGILAATWGTTALVAWLHKMMEA